MSLIFSFFREACSGGSGSGVVARDCLWAEWTEWTQCSTTCDNGIRERSRSKLVQETGGGICLGQATESESCKIKDCRCTDHDVCKDEVGRKLAQIYGFRNLCSKPSVQDICPKMCRVCKDVCTDDPACEDALKVAETGGQAAVDSFIRKLCALTSGKDHCPMMCGEC